MKTNKNNTELEWFSMDQMTIISLPDCVDGKQLSITTGGAFRHNKWYESLKLYIFDTIFGIKHGEAKKRIKNYVFTLAAHEARLFNFVFRKPTSNPFYIILRKLHRTPKFLMNCNVKGI